MALRTELQSQESECKTCTDFVELARQAANETQDEEYVRELLDKAELNCQDPSEYVTLAAFYSSQLDEAETARDLLEQGEEACFEAVEFAQVGYGYANILDDQEKSRELVRQAKEQASTPEEEQQIAELAVQPDPPNVQESSAAEAESFTEPSTSNGKSMASRSELQSQENECQTCTDFVELARQAANETQDEEYVRELLDKAELNCQDPSEYVTLAAFYSFQLDEAETARDLLEQGEEACFEAVEFAQVGYGYANILDDQEKSQELVQQAKEQASTPEEEQQIEELATQSDTLDVQESSAAEAEGFTELSQFQDLAEKLIKSNEAEQARTALQKAERHLNSISEVVEYAKSFKELLNDEEEAVNILNNAEMDCQFPADYIELARGCMSIAASEDKIDELLAEAAQIVMEGNECIEVAQGYWELKQDSEKATEFYEQALQEVTNRDTLLEIAEIAVSTLKNNDLALKCYQTVQSKISSTADLAKLAVTVSKSLKGSEYASEIFTETEQKMSNASELVNLAESAVQTLEDPVRAESIYRKAIANSDSFQVLEQILQSQSKTISNQEIYSESLHKMRSLPLTTRELLSLCQHAMSGNEFGEFVDSALEAAEDAASGAGDLEAVEKLVAQIQPDNTERLEQLQDKIERRRANESKYAELQKRESRASDAMEYIRLAKDAMLQVEDLQYGRKLLDQAHNLLVQEVFDISKWLIVIKVALDVLKDLDLVESLAKDASSKCRHFSSAQTLAAFLIQLKEGNLGTKLSNHVLMNWEPKMESVADRIKFAKTIVDIAKDNTWAAKIVSNCEIEQCSYLQLVDLSALAYQVNDADLAEKLIQAATTKCNSPDKFIQVIRRMRSYGFDETVQINFYREGEQFLSRDIDRLHWAEGILTHFNNHDWAHSAYDSLENSISDQMTRTAYLVSRKQRLENAL